ncbi:MAG: SUF system NifU family Fe-S cluster assembly protein [Anaeroplasmataceae bacterium]|nr:SUF system NifU family Fe-S cluster assembly protein [Anaeroplasmataceae bacterium]MDE5867443.1 SUF system NifU family Fe-S cluster assembly protein [Anaeroplasmataceae bacterium]
MDLKQLYREVIMDHYKNPKNKGLKNTDPYHLVHLTNPSCGDDMRVEIYVDHGQVVDVRQDGIGCSICLSSASVMSDLLIGKSVEEAQKIVQDFYSMVKGEDLEDEEQLGEAIAYKGVRELPARIKCATLAWKCVEKAMNEVEDHE